MIAVRSGKEFLGNQLAQRHLIPARDYVSPSCHTLEKNKTVGAKLSPVLQKTEPQVRVTTPFPSEEVKLKPWRDHISENQTPVSV